MPSCDAALRWSPPREHPAESSSRTGPLLAPAAPVAGLGSAPGYGQQPPALNGFALASLLSGLLCFPPLGMAFGIAALVQIAKRGTGARPWRSWAWWCRW